MITISLCMIVKNEEKTIERCLNSIKGIADEIIIVDTGSTDSTKEIASRFTERIFDFKWVDDFSAARNYSFDQAGMDYILWLDADDIIIPKDAEKFKELKKSLSFDIDVVAMRYNTGFDQHGNVTFSYFRERLLKRSRFFKWQDPVHEYLIASGRIINSDICVTHAKQHEAKSTRNIQIYKNLISQEKELSPRGMYYYARELRENAEYPDAIYWFNEFLATEKGWVEDNITACGELAKCYQAENNSKEALSSLLRSFSYDTPRAEICCQIGYHFMAENNYKQAAFWFELILQLTKPEDNWGFLEEDCWGYIPCIECAVCYDRLGEYEIAARYNDKASEYKPESLPVLYNKKYFEMRNKNVDADIPNH